MLLGEILVGRGLVTAANIRAALELQRRNGARLGEVIVEMKLMTAEQLESVIASVKYATPPQPNSLADTGIAKGLLLDLMLKFMHLRSCESELEISQALRLPYQIVRELIVEANHRGLIQALGARQVSHFIDIPYALNEAGHAAAADAESRNLYVGPAPVSLAAFQEQIQKQCITNEFLDPARLRSGLDGLVFPEHYIRKLLPAINTGRSVLLFGPSGNGKTTVASRIAALFAQVIYVPYAVEIAGQIMTVFDKGLHQPAVSEQDMIGLESQEVGADAYDDRWVACHRPFAVAGGELTLEMLDLQFNREAKFYDAPLHVKALNGVFLVDDFGRQRFDPKALLNRWILPMESRVDYLQLYNGTSFNLPFDELLIFSTNLEPKDIMDPALLRRIPYKIKLFAPDKVAYRRVFDGAAKKAGLALTDHVFEFVVDTLTASGKFGLAYFQPKFICDQVAQICKSFAIEPQLTKELAAEALANLYVEIESEADTVRA
jgi:energy-coupling factor transporter ATP-binding protein EcfA2